ncbi:MAG: hypothetical protein FWE01_00605 [Firmicutes bacterium]|nr:hypothetical protein [Bacillota bacterium]
MTDEQIQNAMKKHLLSGDYEVYDWEIFKTAVEYFTYRSATGGDMLTQYEIDSLLGLEVSYWQMYSLLDEIGLVTKVVALDKIQNLFNLYEKAERETEKTPKITIHNQDQQAITPTTIELFTELVKEFVDVADYNSNDFVALMFDELKNLQNEDEVDWTVLHWQAVNKKEENRYRSMFENESFFNTETLVQVYDTIANEIYQDNRQENKTIRTPQEMKDCIEQFKGGQITTEEFLDRIYDAQDSTGQPMTSRLQRDFRIGFNRASRLIDRSYTQEDIDAITPFIETTIESEQTPQQPTFSMPTPPLPPKAPTPPKPIKSSEPLKPITHQDQHDINVAKKSLQELAFQYDMISSYYELPADQTISGNKAQDKVEQKMFADDVKRIATLVRKLNEGAQIRDRESLDKEFELLQQHHDDTLPQMQSDYGMQWWIINLDIGNDYTISTLAVINESHKEQQTDKTINTNAWANYFARHLNNDMTKATEVATLVQKVQEKYGGGYSRLEDMQHMSDAERSEYSNDMSQLRDYFSQMGEQVCVQVLGMTLEQFRQSSIDEAQIQKDWNEWNQSQQDNEKDSEK